MALENISRKFSGKAIEVFKLSLQEQSVEKIAADTGIALKSAYNLRNRVKDKLIKEIARLRGELE